jgi:hypothetical protein
MVATQFFYTLSLIAMLIAILFVTMFLLCIDDYYKISVLKWTGIDLIVAGSNLAQGLKLGGMGHQHYVDVHRSKMQGDGS